MINMNVLQQAINAIAAVYPSSQIIIKNAKSELINGVDFKNGSEITTMANIQQLKASEISDKTTYVDSYDYRRFFILGDDSRLVSSALLDSSVTSEIHYNNRVYTLFYKEDWSNNGWVICEGVCSGVS